MLCSEYPCSHRLLQDFVRTVAADSRTNEISNSDVPELNTLVSSVLTVSGESCRTQFAAGMQAAVAATDLDLPEAGGRMHAWPSQRSTIQVAYSCKLFAYKQLSSLHLRLHDCVAVLAVPADSEV